MRINFHSTMGRPKTTGCSHNKSSTTYRSDREILTTSGSQNKLTDLFKSKVQEKATLSDNEQQSTSSLFSSPSSSVGIVPVNISSDVNENESSDNPSDHENMDTNAPSDGRSYLVVHRSREKWENLYPFLFFSSKNGWLCIVYSEYGEGDEFWIAKGVTQGEHPNCTFFTHEKSKKHTKIVSKRAEVKRFFSKRSIYKQIYQGPETENQKTKQRNRRIIKKFLRTSYFLARKNWAVRENSEDVIEFLND